MNKTEHPRVFIVDNYDSFTYNLVHLVEQLDCECVVKRNDQFELSELADYSHVLIGPGPGLPSDAGKVLEVINAYSGSKSILGVCLGMQAMLVADGSEMINLNTVKHGARDAIIVDSDSRLFHGFPDSVNVGRYHSWGFTEASISSNYLVKAKSEDGVVMAIEHESLKLFGIQFHPESIMTERGLEMINNWIKA